MSPSPIWKALLAVLVAMLLAGCENGVLTGTAAPVGEAVPAVVPAAKSVLRDVERPDIFKARDTALWDGRPSLGGTWVAHPDVKDPERVRITNTSNGVTIEGALFRRERSNPGPKIQISSDAAEKLGILAGQPTELSIVVLRQEEVKVEPPAAPPEAVAAGAAAADAKGAAAAAGADSGTKATAAAGTAKASAKATAGAAATAGEAAAAVEEGAPAPKKPGFWQRFRDSLRKKPAAEAAGGAAAAATASDASAPSVETAPLKSSAAPAKPEKPAGPAKTSDAAEKSATAPPKAKPTAASKPAARPSAALRNPYIQVGLFSVEENANAAAASLRQAGIVPTVEPIKRGKDSFWRVLIGPVTTADDQALILAQVKKLGYADAFLTPN